jgi:hypothetical protein
MANALIYVNLTKVIKFAATVHFCISKTELKGPCTYSFEVMQSGVWKSVLLDPNLIVLPICVLEPYGQI